MMLGDWNTAEFTDPEFAIFVFASIIEVIVMLNVLIAIVSNSF